MVENDKILSNDKEIAECFKNYFSDVTRSLDIKEWPTPDDNAIFYDDVDKAINKYKNHPSIVKIKEKNGSDSENFKFHHVTPA